MAVTLYEDTAEPNLVGARSAVQELKLLHDDVADRIQLFMSISAAGAAEDDVPGVWFHIVHYTDGTSDPPDRLAVNNIDAPTQTVLWLSASNNGWQPAREPTSPSDYDGNAALSISNTKTFSHSELRYQRA